MFASWLFYMLGALGVFVLRRKMPDTHRPYKAWGYPYTPAVFVIFALLYLINCLVSDIQNSMMGLVLILLGLPIYVFWKRKEKSYEL
jgi:APA family basic amino acid/polyamine antiporter